MKPKEALAKDGKVPVSMGKGRLSLAAKARLVELVALGWDIEGYSPSSEIKVIKPSARKPRAVKNTRKRAAPVEYDDIVTLMPYRFDLSAFKAVSEKPIFGATEFTLKEVCSFCHVSLCVHVCDEPRILGDYRVDIVPV